jgi:hypothetical protein
MNNHQRPAQDSWVFAISGILILGAIVIWALFH